MPPSPKNRPSTMLGQLVGVERDAIDTRFDGDQLLTIPAHIASTGSVSTAAPSRSSSQLASRSRSRPRVSVGAPPAPVETVLG